MSECKNTVFTTGGPKPCGTKEEDGTVYLCVECLESSLVNAGEAVDILAQALHLAHEEYESTKELSEDTMQGIKDLLVELGYRKPERQQYAH
ncbi:hypothetical protein VPHD85_0082 [Vibrio phage D85]|nr:hypothetical protein PODOV033v1_p0060 [Vibrio phage 252E42.2]